MKNIKIIGVAFLLNLCSTVVSAQTLDEIVTKHIEAVGGKENWNKIKSMKIDAVIKQQGAEFHLTSYMVDKKAYRSNFTAMGMTSYNIITNTEGWNYSPFQGQTKPEPITADDLKNEQDDLYLADKFITYKELGKTLDYYGKDDFDGTECYKLKMIDKIGKETTYYLDVENYLVLKETTKRKVNGQVEEGTETFSDYKTLPEGVVYPMYESGMEITKIEINPSIDNALFQVPKQ